MDNEIDTDPNEENLDVEPVEIPPFFSSSSSPIIPAPLSPKK